MALPGRCGASGPDPRLNFGQESGGMTRIQGIVFDMDGTLFDFQATWGPGAGA
jgi:hypothetical protein